MIFEELTLEFQRFVATVMAFMILCVLAALVGHIVNQKEKR